MYNLYIQIKIYYTVYIIHGRLQGYNTAAYASAWGGVLYKLETCGVVLYKFYKYKFLRKIRFRSNITRLEI